MNRIVAMGMLVATISLLSAVPARAAAISIFDPGVSSELAIRWNSGGGSPFNNDFVATCPLVGSTGDLSGGTMDCLETAAGLLFSGTFDSPNGAVAGTYNVNFYEFAGGPLSDTLTFTLEYIGGTTVRVTGAFISDNDNQPFGVPALPNAASIFEDIDGRFAFQTGNWAGPSDFTIVATSDADAGGAPVPEPATLLLLCTGLVGTAVRRRTRG